MLVPLLFNQHLCDARLSTVNFLFEKLHVLYPFKIWTRTRSNHLHARQEIAPSLARTDIQAVALKARLSMFVSLVCGSAPLIASPYLVSPPSPHSPSAQRVIVKPLLMIQIASQDV